MKLILVIVTAIILPSALMAGVKIPLGAAEGLCAERAERYSQTIAGSYGDHPDYWQIQDHYRSCVHAKAGENPTQKLVLNTRLLFNLNSVFTR